MALRGAAARRYAQAVFDLAKDTKGLDKWLTSLKALNSVFGTENAVVTLEDPKLTDADRRRLVNEKLPKEASDPLAVNLLMLLVERERLRLLPRIVEIYQELYNKEKGIIIAQVTTAVPLDEEHKRRVAEGIARLTGGKSVELRLTEDPRILGGLITRIGDELIDSSIASRLAGLQERLS